MKIEFELKFCVKVSIKDLHLAAGALSVFSDIAQIIDFISTWF